MNEAEARELAFRLYLRNIEPAKIVQALAREQGLKVEVAEIAGAREHRVEVRAEQLARVDRSPGSVREHQAVVRQFPEPVTQALLGLAPLVNAERLDRRRPIGTERRDVADFGSE
ncbi:MAG: hypothetical protein ACRDF0_04740 [Candidatus Limnocylindria bacterium]